MSSNAKLYNKISIFGNKAPPIQEQKYKGFSTINPNASNFSLYDLELVKQDIVNHFYIRQGEKLMNPTFGTIIWDLLFEPLTPQTTSLITQNVTTIINYDPRVNASNVIVSAYETGIQVECVLTYLPYNISQAMQLSFDQNNGLLAR